MHARTAWATATLVACVFATLGVLASLCQLGSAAGTLAAVIAPRARTTAPRAGRTRSG